MKPKQDFRKKTNLGMAISYLVLTAIFAAIPYFLITEVFQILGDPGAGWLSLALGTIATILLRAVLKKKAAKKWEKPPHKS